MPACNHLLKPICLIFALLLSGETVIAQFPWPKGGDHVEITRRRPAEIHLANSTMMVQVTTASGCSPTLTERLKKLITNGVLGSNRTMREVATSPQVLIECSVTRCEFYEKTEKRKLLGVKNEGMYKTVIFTLEASYKVARVRDNFVYFADNVTAPYKKDFQVDVDRIPAKPEIEDLLINYVLRSILSKLTDTDETYKVLLMGKDNLSRYARLAQGGQWSQYIESVSSLPEKKPDKDGRSEFEGDRNYNLCVAYEALAYEQMWKDYDRAAKYFDLANSSIRKAQQFDPREKEYVNALTRLLQGKKYFETIQERFPGRATVASSGGGQGERGISTPNPEQKPSPPSSGGQKQPTSSAMTNLDVIKMVQAGMSEDFIIERIRATREKQFDISPNGLIQLKNGGVSERLIRVITGMLEPKPPRRRSVH